MNDPKERAIPKLPRGFADLGPADIAATEKMLAEIKESYELYGFDAVETPLIEYTEALGKFLPDQDRPNEGVFSFQDDDEQWLSLRYDLTAPLARYVAENFDRLPKPYRSYRVGIVFRNEKPGPGRYRQFMQFDADTVGAKSIAADAEMCMMAADTLERLGIKRGDYVIKVNSRKVLDGVMETIGLGGEENAGRRLKVLRAIDKFDRLGPHGVILLLGRGRKDESGDFTKGADLDPSQIDSIMRFLGFAAHAIHGYVPEWPTFTGSSSDMNEERLKWLEEKVELGTVGKEGVAELREIARLACAAGYDETRIRVDRTVVRGLEYYTGPVFEADLTFVIRGDDGNAVRFGSVGGGGRYDGLIGRFRDEDVPATGFSIGVSRLYAALKAINSPIVSTRAQRGPVIVLVLDQSEMARYQSFVAQLRSDGIAAELYLGSSGMNAQLKYADKRGAICAVIQGSNERAKGEVAIRDLVLGAKLAASTKDRADYLDLRTKAQFCVPEAELVKAVREVLARHE
ncbi:MAG TPA: histidine--tRNA ligase [Methylovirgula sp.]|nr:histidine--tRNA ligase [Methylovirgula sp.]